MKKLFITANETYFICKGEHCLQTWKDDGKILENFAGKPGKYLRGKEPNIASHGDLAIQIGERNWLLNVILYSSKKIERKWTAFVQEIPSRLVHISATEGLKK